MTNTIENNKLIAEFMGNFDGWDYKLFDTGTWEFQTPDFLMATISFKSIKPTEFFTTTIFKSYEVKFHLDWNWLMEVVDKIDFKTTMKNDDYFQVTIGKHQTSIIRKNKISIPYLNEQIVGEGESKIEATYNACISFIKWYNKNKN